MSYQEKQNQGQIVGLMALAMIFAYLFLVAQYESWSIPIPVMMTVSTAVFGAMLGIWACTSEWAMNHGFGAAGSLSIYAQLGLVMAILMVEFSKQAREAGHSIVEAGIQGFNMRYRAVLMTAWSFIFGVIPLVFATGAGANSRTAIGVTTGCGMLMATLVGIMLTPGLYSAMQHVREGVKHAIGMKTALASSSSREDVVYEMSRLGALEYFDAVICGDQVTKSKPDPEIFIKAADLLGLDPSVCMGLDDSFNGVKACKAAGLYTVMVPDILQPDDEIKKIPDVIVGSLKDVMELL